MTPIHHSTNWFRDAPLLAITIVVVANQVFVGHRLIAKNAQEACSSMLHRDCLFGNLP